jgi:Na+/H+-translocating membrane pyrophosphatase
MDNWRVPLLALICFVIGAVVAGAFGRAGWRRGVLATVGVAAAAMAWGTFMAQVDEGWAGLGRFLFGLLFAFPAFLGALLGGWIGLRLHRRRHG